MKSPLAGTIHIVNVANVFWMLVDEIESVWGLRVIDSLFKYMNISAFSETILALGESDGTTSAFVPGAKPDLNRSAPNV